MTSSNFDAVALMFASAGKPNMTHLRCVGVRNKQHFVDSFPFNVPVIRALDTLDFPTAITFFVGENGSGKSTLLEAIACAARLPTIGAEHVDSDPTLEPVRRLSDSLRWTWNKRTRRGFFMRSEDFFGFARRIHQTQAELRAELERVDREYANRSAEAQGLARMAFAGELHGIQKSYGEGLDAQSHGESYFKLFQSRFVPDGLYLLDEPEAPLSPMRQLSLIAMLKLMLDQNAQFIIATHSPILLAYPGATIYNFEEGTIQQTDYESLEHVRITRSFLENPQAYLKHLLE